MNAPSGGEEAGGLFAALRQSAATLLATARTRIELAGNELDSERVRLVRLLVCGVSALICFAFGLLLVIALVVAVFWESRVALLGGLAALFVIAGGVLLAMMKRANQHHQPFAATISELEEDIRQLRATTGHGQKSPD